MVATGTVGVNEALLERVAQLRDRRAFGQLFDYFGPRLKAFLMRQGSDSSAAEELMQEAMLTVWRRAETYDRQQASAATWIFTIARNKRIDMLRRERRPEFDPEDPALMPEVEGVEARITASQEASILRQAIQRLPPEQAKLVRMAYFDDKVHTTIAAETGVPLGTVKSRLRLAMKRLRSELTEVEESQ